MNISHISIKNGLSKTIQNYVLNAKIHTTTHSFSFSESFEITSTSSSSNKEMRKATSTTIT